MIIKETLNKYKLPLLVLIGIILVIITIIFVNLFFQNGKIIVQDKLILYENRLDQLSVEFTGKNTLNENNLNLKIDDESIVNINSQKINKNILSIGLLPIKSGKTSLEIKNNNKSKMVDLVVCKSLSPDVIVSKEIKMKQGYVIENIFSSNYFEECQENITISSQDTSIIEVKNKSIKALKEGKTILTISNGNNTINVDVAVLSKNTIPTDVKLEKDNINIKTGQMYKLSYELEPKGSDPEFLKWSSSDNNIAIVDNGGIITGINKGSAIITVSSIDNNMINKTIKVNVTIDPETAEIKFNQNSISISEGETKKLNYEILPKDVTYKSIYFTTEDSSILSIKNDGTITGIKQGETYIYGNIVKESGRVKQAKIKVIITKPNYINVKSIDITGSYNLELNKTYNLSYKISPSNASGYKVNYSSSNSNIISISSSGKLTAKSNGSAKVYVTITNHDGSVVKDSITVSTIVKKIYFERKYAAVEIGSKYTLPFKTSPADSSIKPTYKSGNTSIATVDSNGVIKGINTGETTVTASYQGKSATIKVRVVGIASKTKPALLYDLSVYNTVSSWQRMKDNGINYAILRLGITNSINSTNTGKDRKFDSYVAGARSNNIELGVYYFSKASSTSAAQNEAKFVLKTLNSYPNGTFSLPIFIDYEQEGCPLNATGAKYIKAFCDVIEAGGYYCGAYTYYYMFNYDMGSNVKAIWVPDWTCNASGKDKVSNLGIWQFSAPQSSSCRNPKVFGVDFADNNYMYINYATKIINSGYNNFK